jgi:hypothetical protein
MKRRRILLVAAAFAALAVIAAIVAVVVVSSPDANHRSAVEVARNAGIPAGVTPGPPP